MPAPLDVKADYIAQRYYNLPIPSQKEIPDNYEHDDDEDEMDKTCKKVERGDILVVDTG